jgi:hypothetical protein
VADMEVETPDSLQNAYSCCLLSRVLRNLDPQKL